MYAGLCAAENPYPNVTWRSFFKRQAGSCTPLTAKDVSVGNRAASGDVFFRNLFRGE